MLFVYTSIFVYTPIYVRALGIISLYYDVETPETSEVPDEPEDQEEAEDPSEPIEPSDPNEPIDPNKPTEPEYPSEQDEIEETTESELAAIPNIAESAATAQNISFIFPEDDGGMEIFFVTAGSVFGLLDDVYALDENGEAVEVFVIDNGGFNLNPEWPDNMFTVVYGAIHLETEEEFLRDRQIVVTVEMEPYSVVQVTTFLELFIALTTPADNLTIEVMNDLDFESIIPATSDTNATLVSGRAYDIVEASNTSRRRRDPNTGYEI